MKGLSEEQRAAIDAIYDEAIGTNRKPKGGCDHVAAASEAMDAIRALVAGNQPWAATVLDARELDGHKAVVRRRAGRGVVVVPNHQGRKVDMPTTYSHRTDDGSRQLTMWLYMSLEELVVLVESMTKQAASLTEHALVMSYGVELARKHGVATAAEGFAAEGIDVEAVA